MSTTDKALGKTPTTVRRRIAFDWRRDIIYVGFVAVVIVFSILLRDQGFISTTSLMNILRQTAIVTVIAVGMTYVIAAAEIDLSVGSVAGLASVLTAMASFYHRPFNSTFCEIQYGSHPRINFFTNFFPRCLLYRLILSFSSFAATSRTV